MLPRLGINHLSVLAVLAESGSLTATAGRLGVTQSAVSHRLREAERRLGVKLTQREGGAIALTPEGERLRRFADSMLEELARLEQDLAARQRSGQRLVRLGQATYSRYHWLPAFLEDLARQEPDLSVDLSGQATARPFASLADGAVDVSLVYGRPAREARFRWHRLGTDPLVAVLSPAHRLAGAAALTSEAVAEERVFTYPLTVEPGFEWEQLIGRPSVPLRRIAPMPTPEAVIDLVRAGYGIAVFSRWAISPELEAGSLIAKPLGPEETLLDWWAVTRRSETADGPAARLAAAFVRWAARYDRPMTGQWDGAEERGDLHGTTPLLSSRE